MEEKRKQIIKEHYPIGKTIIATTLFLIFGIGIISTTNIFEVTSKEMFFEVLFNSSFQLSFGALFIFMHIYIMTSFILDVIIKPKKKVLYLYDNTNYSTSIFINKSGKKYEIPYCRKEKNKYYYVIKTYNYIYEVLDECHETFKGWNKRIKKSYWLNIYTPMGDYEDMLLLPILYSILMPGLLTIILAKGFGKVYGIIWSLLPGYILIYDLICKIKKKNDSDYTPHFLNKIYNIIYKIFAKLLVLVILLGISIFCLMTMYNMKDTTFKLAFLPFPICTVFIFATTLTKYLGNRELYKIFLKIYYILFFVFWFGALTFATISFFKEGASLGYLLFIIPFWLAGIFMAYKLLIKK